MRKIITEELVWQCLPRRSPQSHKGTYGKVLAITGSTRYRGAAALATEGLLRGGAGLVSVATVEAAAAVILPRLPEAMILSCRTDAEGGISAEEAPRLAAFLAGCNTLLMGPGLGWTPDTSALVQALVPAAKGTVVLDADALNAVSELAALPHPAEGELILTPHAGEMARLCGCTVAEAEARREETALRYARENRCVVVLKGHETLIAAPDGRLWQNTTGNAGLARGGSGDVLAGLITALAAQGLSAPEAALCGVWLHGAAADACAERLGQYGMLPHDIFADLGRLFARNGR